MLFGSILQSRVSRGRPFLKILTSISLPPRTIQNSRFVFGSSASTPSRALANSTASIKATNRGKRVIAQRMEPLPASRRYETYQATTLGQLTKNNLPNGRKLT